MSGNSEPPLIDLDRLLFEACREQSSRQLFVTAWLVIDFAELADSTSLCPIEVDWVSTQLGQWPDEESLKQELLELDLDKAAISEAGCYLVQGLFTIKRDGDGYQYWYYLEEKIVEFDWQCSLAEYRNPVKLFDPVEASPGICDLEL
jgi:hypothetical protein